MTLQLRRLLRPLLPLRSHLLLPKLRDGVMELLHLGVAHPLVGVRQRRWYGQAFLNGRPLRDPVAPCLHGGKLGDVNAAPERYGGPWVDGEVGKA
jgi:hypothetical protein